MKFRCVKDGHEVVVAEGHPQAGLFTGPAWEPVAEKKPARAAAKPKDDDEEQ